MKLVGPVLIEELRRELVPGWEVHWCGDPWTQFNPHIIHMKEFEDPNDTLQCFLHEVTHALLGKGGHGIDFWAKLKLLVQKHLRRELCPMQDKMMRDYLGAEMELRP